MEEEVLALMVRGLKDRQIAEAMGLSYETVRNYVLGTLKEASCLLAARRAGAGKIDPPLLGGVKGRGRD